MGHIYRFRGLSYAEADTQHAVADGASYIGTISTALINGPEVLKKEIAATALLDIVLLPNTGVQLADSHIADSGS